MKRPLLFLVLVGAFAFGWILPIAAAEQVCAKTGILCSQCKAPGPQCVNYVKTRFPETSVWRQISVGSAKEWWGDDRHKDLRSSSPVIGSAMILDVPPYGHAAYVRQVEADGTDYRVIVDHSNFDCCCTISTGDAFILTRLPIGSAPGSGRFIGGGSAGFGARSSMYRVLGFILPGETAAKPPAQTVQASPVVPRELTFRMKDGSTVSGQVQAAAIKMKSSVGIATVPVSDIVAFSDGQLRLKDGSVLKGELAVSSLPVVSKYGTLQLSAKDIVWFGVGTPPAVASTPSPSSPAAAAKPSSSAPAPVAPASPSVPPRTESGAGVPIPRQYGVYLVAGWQLHELREESVEGSYLQARGVWDLVARCCSKPQQIDVPEGIVKILVYERGLPGFTVDLRTHVYVRKTKRITYYDLPYEKIQQQVGTVKNWIADPEQRLITKVAPVPGQQEMVLIEANDDYVPGVYSFQLKADSIPPFRFPRGGWAVFKVSFTEDLEDFRCEDWVFEDVKLKQSSWIRDLPENQGKYKMLRYPCRENAVPEADGQTWRSAKAGVAVDPQTGITLGSNPLPSARNPGPTAALPPSSGGGTGQTIKVRFVNESSGPVRLQITGNSKVGVGGQSWVTIQPGKSDEIPVMSGPQKLRVEKVRTAGPVILWAGFRRERTVEIAPDKSVQITDDDFK